MVEAVGDEEGGRRRRVDGHAVGEVESGLRGWSAFSTKAQPPVAGYGVNPLAVRQHLADDAVIAVGDEDVAGLVERDSNRVAEGRLGCQIAVAAIARNPGSSSD